MLRRRTLAGLTVALPFIADARAQAQGDWPDRPLRLIVPFAPGGANDIVARLLAQKLTEALGQPCVVENRPGAQATLGTELVARARPDGTTLLVAASGPITVSPATNPRLSYDPRRDLAPISLLADFPLVLLVGADRPVQDLAGLAAWARAEPGRMSYAFPSASFQLAHELLKQRTGIEAVPVAYRGSADCVNAVAAGDVAMVLTDSGPATAGLQSGRVKALAITAAERLPGFPGVPTMAESGLPEMQIALWTGLLAPAGTPGPVIERLHHEAARAMAAPDLATRLTALAMRPVGSTPAQFRETISREILLWSEVAQRSNIRFQ